MKVMVTSLDPWPPPLKAWSIYFSSFDVLTQNVDPLAAALAGAPIYAVETLADSYTVPNFRITGFSFFAVEVCPKPAYPFTQTVHDESYKVATSFCFINSFLVS